MMNMELKPDLEQRLHEVAQRRSLSVPELIENVLTTYLDAQDDSPMATVRGTRPLLAGVWPTEDFSDWPTPDDR
jgi:predicted transcriptional regulator